MKILRFESQSISQILIMNIWWYPYISYNSLLYETWKGWCIKAEWLFGKLKKRFKTFKTAQTAISTSFTPNWVYILHFFWWVFEKWDKNENCWIWPRRLLRFSVVIGSPGNSRVHLWSIETLPLCISLQQTGSQQCAF